MGDINKEREFTLHYSNQQLPEGLQCIVFVPDTPFSTNEARALLPATLSKEDAVFNMGRCALLVNAFASNRLEDLQQATQGEWAESVCVCVCVCFDG